jgi:hypothetical protein
MTQAAHQPIGTVTPGRRSLGYVSYGIGCTLVVVVGTLLGGSFLTSLPDDQLLSSIVTICGLVLAALALLAAAEGFLVPSARDVCRYDPRKPVLFLRPFGEDKPLTYDVFSAGETTTTIMAKAEDFLLALNAVGPLVSIGEPTWLSKLGIYPHGAFRDYVERGEWQHRVEELLDQAGMVVLAVGDSPGIEWEIVEARKRIGPESLLVCLSPRPALAFTRKSRARKERTVYEHFAPMLRRHFEIDLPPFSEALYVIGFDASGTPIMAAEAERSRWALSEYDRVAASVTSQLRAVLAKVRPDIDLDHYRVPGRAALFWRLSLTLTGFVAPLGYGLWNLLR